MKKGALLLCILMTPFTMSGSESGNPGELVSREPNPSIEKPDFEESCCYGVVQKLPLGEPFCGELARTELMDGENPRLVEACCTLPFMLGMAFAFLFC